MTDTTNTDVRLMTLGELRAQVVNGALWITANGASAFVELVRRAQAASTPAIPRSAVLARDVRWCAECQALVAHTHDSLGPIMPALVVRADAVRVADEATLAQAAAT